MQDADFKRATFDLATRRETVIESSMLTVWKYTVAANVAVDASENS